MNETLEQQARRARRNFTDAHKRELVNRILDDGQSLTVVARQENIDSGTLSRWVAKERGLRTQLRHGALSDSEISNKILGRLDQLEERVEVLRGILEKLLLQRTSTYFEKRPLEVQGPPELLGLDMVNGQSYERA